MTAGFGTAGQRRAYIIRSLASGATIAHLASHLDMSTEDVRRIASEAATPESFWDEFCPMAGNVRRKCFHCKVEAGLNPSPYANSNPVPVTPFHLSLAGDRSDSPYAKNNPVPVTLTRDLP